MANTPSAKGNPASKRMSNPKNKEKRLRNKLKNERLREKGEHPKQIRDRKNRAAAELNAFMIEHYGFASTGTVTEPERASNVIAGHPRRRR